MRIIEPGNVTRSCGTLVMVSKHSSEAALKTIIFGTEILFQGQKLSVGNVFKYAFRN